MINLFTMDIDIAYLEICKELNQEIMIINTSDDTNKFMNSLALFNIYIDYYINYLKINKIYGSEINKYMIYINKIKNKIYENIKIYEKIKEHRTNLTENDLIYMCDDINNNIIDTISKKEINNKKINVLNEIYKTNPNNFNKNLCNYTNQKERIEYEKEICNKIKMNEVCEIINMKIEFNINNNKNFNLMKKNIMELNDIFRDNFNDKIKENINKIKKELKIDHVHLIDVLYYFNKNKSYNEKKHEIESNIKLIIKFINYYFGINIKEIFYEKKLWRNNIKSYIIKHNNIIIGYLHLDLYYDKTKTITIPTYILLNKTYNNNGIQNISNVCIIGNFKQDELINYDDIIHIYKLFGNVIKDVIYKSNYGIIIDNSYINILFNCIFEHIALNDIISNLILKKKSNTLSTNVILLKLKCINQIYDFILNAHDKHINEEDLKIIYLNIFRDILPDIEYDDNIHINTLIQIINAEGDMWIYLMNKIVGYNIAESIINNRHGKKFIETVCLYDLENIKDNVKTFIKDYCMSSNESIIKYIEFINNKTE